MNSGDKDRKQAEALAKAVERLFGNAIEAEMDEVDAVFGEFGQGIDPKQQVYELASKAAQAYRLQNKPVPPHVAEALKATGRSPSLAAADSSKLQEIIDSVLTPLRGPAQTLSYAFRHRKGGSESDEKILDDLSREVQDDWKDEK